MDRITAYQDDIYAWSQEQAAVLRRLAETRRDLPNELDLNHVAEEIEDVGRSELRTVGSFAELLLRHLVKLASAPDAPAARHWAAEARLQQKAVADEFRPFMRQVFDLDKIWTAACVRADADLDAHGNTIGDELPTTCPFTIDELVGVNLDVAAAVRRIAPIIQS